MMELVNQMQSKQQENKHPNKDKNQSPNDSFSSDDILETLDAKDQPASNPNDIQEKVQSLNAMTDEEFSRHIQSALLPAFERKPKNQSKSEEEVKYTPNKTQTAIAEKFGISLNPHYIPDSEYNNDNGFIINTDLGNNSQDEEAVEFLSHAKPLENNKRVEEIESPREAAETPEYTEVQPFTLD